jgi:DNA-binding transcriptional MocR family regulator
VGDHGVDVEALGRAIERERPRLVVLTPNFQNPTGTTMPEAARRAVLALVGRAGVILVENDLYGELRYRGAAVPSLKSLEMSAHNTSGDTILFSSFSKIAFPGLRVGWAIGPRRFIARLTEAKESSDLHSDQLSQAVLLQFAASGRLQAHRDKMRASGSERLNACLAACAKELPPGSSYTRPDGGMNVWVRLPEPLDADAMASRAERDGVSFLPGRYFAVSRPQASGLRLSFAGLDVPDIQAGMAVLGRIFRSELDRMKRSDEINVLV